MKIKFKQVDKKYYGIDEYVLPIVKLAIKYETFVIILCEILNVYDTYSTHITNDVTRALKYASYKIDNKNEVMIKDYNALSSALETFYLTVVDDTDFENNARNFDEELQYPDKRLGRYRGILLEELVAATVKERFSKKRFCTGCQIYINGSRVISLYDTGNARHKETIDIVGWSDFPIYGEFYECKINPKRFKKENYDYFIKLKHVLDENNCRNYILALVSSDTKKNLIAQKKALEDDSGFYIDFELLGREDIYSILSFTIPETIEIA